MASNNYRCNFCGKDSFSTKRGLKQHQLTNRACLSMIKASLRIKEKKAKYAHHYLPTTTVVTEAPSRMLDSQSLFTSNKTAGDFSPLDKTVARMPIRQGCDSDSEHSYQNFQPNLHTEVEDDQTIASLSAKQAATTEELGAVDNSLWTMFNSFVSNEKRASEFTQAQINAIRLLSMLRSTNASLKMYESVMKWHFECTGEIRPHETVTSCTSFISRDTMFDHLSSRYALSRSLQQTTKIILPSSKAHVSIVWNDAKALMISLLTDPKIKDEDYMFFGDDPLAPPPDNLRYVKDLNTGRAYRKTFAKLITNVGKQVLLPVIFYIDGANTGHFADLPVTAVKFSLGIFTRKARENEYCWRILGYIPAVEKFTSKARRLMIDSLHLDGVMAHPDALEDEGKEDEADIEPAQDFHTMLDLVLNSYIELQNTGFYWDLKYKNKVYKDIEFVLFTPFIKVDTEEADKLCGKYQVRTGAVSQICRYCECPTKQTGSPLANFPLKTQQKISRLIRQGNLTSLKQLSQHCIHNALYKVRFGLHNDQGIHGACPMEMLHALLLGIFRYVRDAFFTHIGETSKLADQVNALSKEYGWILSRQSDRNMPVTKFANGIKRGKLMAQEYPGILLCMAAVLRSTDGRVKLTRRKAQFGTFERLRDWSQLIETLLQWERWLRSDEMEKRHVYAAKKKHRWILNMVKKVAVRTEKMGWKLMKYHGFLHVADDILNFGVPMEVDTGANESGHKSTKKAAKLTQRNEATFDHQTDNRLNEVRLLDLAMQELSGKAMHFYGDIEDEEDIEEEQDIELRKIKEGKPIGGATYVMRLNPTTGDYEAIKLTKNSEPEREKLEQGLIMFVLELQRCVSAYLPSVPLRSRHIREGLIFRAQAKFRGDVWRDWALIDWGIEGKLPMHLSGFVDLRDIPENTGLVYGGIPLQPGIYAVAENAQFDDDTENDDNFSDLFRPITKEVAEIRDNIVARLRYYLADVEAIVQPIAVIPDIGGPPNGYFYLKDREQWVKMFCEFLEDNTTDWLEDISDSESRADEARSDR